jgi:ribose transport system substrate-binding protein
MYQWTARLVASCLAVTALVVAGCGGDDDDDGGAGGGKEVTIGWTPPDITGVFKTATDFFEESAAGANEAGFDVEVVSRSPETHTAYADQLAIIEDFVSQQVDAIAISPADTEAVKPAIQRANEAGIPVIMVNLLEPQEDIEVASYIGFDNSEAAAVSAYSVLDYYGGPGVLGSGEKVKVDPETFLDLEWWEKTYADADKNAPKGAGAVIEGIAGTFFSEERINGFNEVLGEYPNMEVLGEPIAADWNREKGVSAAEDFLSRYSPQEMNFIWAASNEMGLGAIQATEREGVLNTGGSESQPPTDQVSIFTNDATPESADAVRDGTLIAETHHGFPEWGWFGTEFAVRLACGEEVPEQQDIRPRTMYQGNVDQFYPEPKLPEIDWAEIAANCE